MKPTTGRIVIYHTTEDERKQIGSATELPAVVTAVTEAPTENGFVHMCNLQIIPNLSSTWLMAENALEGTDEGNWSWPVINKK